MSGNLIARASATINAAAARVWDAQVNPEAIGNTCLGDDAQRIEKTTGRVNETNPDAHFRVHGGPTPDRKKDSESRDRARRIPFGNTAYRMSHRAGSENEVEVKVKDGIVNWECRIARSQIRDPRFRILPQPQPLREGSVCSRTTVYNVVISKYWLPIQARCRWHAATPVQLRHCGRSEARLEKLYRDSLRQARNVKLVVIHSNNAKEQQ
jgi:hypothetical protein